MLFWLSRYLNIIFRHLWSHLNQMSRSPLTTFLFLPSPVRPKYRNTGRKKENKRECFKIPLTLKIFLPQWHFCRKGYWELLAEKLLTYEDQLTTWTSTPELYNVKVCSLSNFFSPKRKKNLRSQPESQAFVSAEISFAN